VQCLKLLGSYNIILFACVVGLSESVCASYVAILDHTKHRDNAGSAGMCERTLYAVRRIPISCFMCLVLVGRPRTSTDGRHHATVTISRYRRGLCRDIAIKKVHDSSPTADINLRLPTRPRPDKPIYLGTKCLYTHSSCAHG